jgi:hypothetical protein
MLLLDKIILSSGIMMVILLLFCGIRILYFSYKYETYLYKKCPERIKELSIAATFACDTVSVLDTYKHLFGNINCEDATLILFRKKVRWAYLWAFIIWFSGLMLIFMSILTSMK